MLKHIYETNAFIVANIVIERRLSHSLTYQARALPTSLVADGAIGPFQIAATRRTTIDAHGSEVISTFITLETSDTILACATAATFLTLQEL